jgi:hypothetical protein
MKETGQLAWKQTSGIYEKLEYDLVKGAVSCVLVLKVTKLYGYIIRTQEREEWNSRGKIIGCT